MHEIDPRQRAAGLDFYRFPPPTRDRLGRKHDTRKGAGLEDEGIWLGVCHDLGNGSVSFLPCDRPSPWHKDGDATHLQRRNPTRASPRHSPGIPIHAPLRLKPSQPLPTGPIDRKRDLDGVVCGCGGRTRLDTLHGGVRRVDEVHPHDRGVAHRHLQPGQVRQQGAAVAAEHDPHQRAVFVVRELVAGERGVVEVLSCGWDAGVPEGCGAEREGCGFGLWGEIGGDG